jgi:hypothetical protein
MPSSWTWRMIRLVVERSSRCDRSTRRARRSNLGAGYTMLKSPGSRGGVPPPPQSRGPPRSLVLIFILMCPSENPSVGCWPRGSRFATPEGALCRLARWPANLALLDRSRKNRWGSDDISQADPNQSRSSGHESGGFDRFGTSRDLWGRWRVITGCASKVADRRKARPAGAERAFFRDSATVYVIRSVHRSFDRLREPARGWPGATDGPRRAGSRGDPPGEEFHHHNHGDHHEACS